MLFAAMARLVIASKMPGHTCVVIRVLTPNRGVAPRDSRPLPGFTDRQYRSKTAASVENTPSHFPLGNCHASSGFPSLPFASLPTPRKTFCPSCKVARKQVPFGLVETEPFQA